MATLQNVDDVYPLTATQLGMLYHTVSDPTSGVYVNQVITPISGNLDVDRFKAIWDQVVERHDTLRTAFIWDGVDDPLQVVRSAVATEWRDLVLDGISDPNQEAQFSELLAADRARSFDLAQPPLCRMALVRFGQTEWRWVWTFHHLIADGWSANLLLDEVFTRYGASRHEHFDPADAPRYREFIADYLARDERREETFWTQRLAGFTEPQRLDVPGLPPEPGDSGYLTHVVQLELHDSDRIATTAKELNVTSNAFFLGAWALVLSRWTRSDDVVFGATFAGRPSTVQGVERATGLFINTLPQRIHVNPRDELGPWLRGVQRSQIETREYEQSSLAAAQRWSDVDVRESLFDNIFVFENYPRAAPRSRFGEIEIGEREFIEQSNYPLAVLVVPGTPATISFIYDSAVVSTATVESLASQFTVTLASIAENPQARLGEYRLTSRADEAWLRGVGIGPDVEGGSGTILDLVHKAAASNLDVPAVVDRDGPTSYADLLARAGAIADRLAGAGVGPNQLVGLHLERSAEMIAGMLGILMAGGAYVPLDPQYPTAHVRALLSGDDIGFVLTSSGFRDRIPPDVTTVLVDDAGSIGDAVNRLAATESDLAYVIHTSGSSGPPKGVTVTHRNLVRSTMARAIHYQTGVGRFLLLSSFAFDSSVVGIFWTLSTGGTLVLPAQGLEMDVDALLTLAHGQQVTHTLCLPSLYEVLLEHATGGELDSLRVAIVAGEACPSRILESHRLRLPAAELHNEYGPTEATVWCTAHRASPGDDVLPIGKPIAGSRIYLLDDSGNLVPPGFSGEICIAGDGVVPGYHGRPDLTAERFVSIDIAGIRERIYRSGDLGAWRADGVLTYLGRADTQLKVRGHRIEPAAVESALLLHPAVREAVAIARSAPGGPGSQLIAYVATDQGDLVADEIRRAMAPSLPDFMVPDIVIPLAALPRLPNGKVDIGSLPEPGISSSGEEGHVEPRTDRERVLAAIWSELLGIEMVGVKDDFFELGGDSIVSIRMISRARQAGITLDPGQIARNPTIEQLALAADGEVKDRTLAVSGPVPLGPIQHWFFEMNHAAPHYWNQSKLFALHVGVDPSALEHALRACVDHHDMLRARFTRSESTWTQSVDPEAELAFEIVRDPGDVEQVVADCQASLKLDSGPLFRAVLIERTTSEPHLLLLAVHHLIIDAVSWTILVDDLDYAYRAASGGEAIAFPDRSTSYRDWVLHLDSRDFGPERDYWAGVGPVPQADVPRTWGTEATRRSVTVELESDATRLLLRDANDAYRTRPDELMIAALAPVIEKRADGTVCIAVERHGRAPDVPGIDMSRTVGWFTAQYPVTLSTMPADDAELISVTKETLRNVPSGGLGYGVLKYLHRVPELANQPEPAYLFNFLGGASFEGRGFLKPMVGADPSGRHPDNSRAHRIEIVAGLTDGRLALTWYFSASHDDDESITAQANAHLDRLRALVSYCTSGDAGGVTPSDFPTAGLDQDELDRFLGGLG